MTTSETLSELIEHIHDKEALRQVTGLACKEEGTVWFTPRKFLVDLDQLPMPAYDLIDPQNYLKNKYLYLFRSFINRKSISMFTSRGCPFDCVFCSIKLHMGKRFRYHSPEYVVNHLEYLTKNIGIKNVHFEDDNFSLNKKRFERILDLIIERGIKINWDIPNGVRADSLDLNLLKKMKQSGGTQLKVAIESGNQQVLNDVVKKKTSLKYIEEVLRHGRELGFNTAAFYIIGLPGETLENMKETVELAERLYRDYQVRPVVDIATPLYGTELYDTSLEKGYITKKLTAHELSTASYVTGDPILETEDFTKEDVAELAQRAHNIVKKGFFKWLMKTSFIDIYRFFLNIIQNGFRQKHWKKI